LKSNSNKNPEPESQGVFSNNHQELNYASLMHLSGLSIVTGIPFINIIIPTCLWLAKKEKSPIIDLHGRLIINFQITITLLQLTFLFIGTVAIWLMPELIKDILDATRIMKIVFATTYNLPFNLFTFIPFILALLIGTISAIAAYHGEIAPSIFGFKFLDLPLDQQDIEPPQPPKAAPTSTSSNSSPTPPLQGPKRTTFG